MGLGRLFNRNIQYSVTDTVTGATDAFTVVTDGSPGMYADWSYGAYRGGMSLPGAYRASILLSDLLGAVPWHAYRERATGPLERINPTPPLLLQPAPPDSRMTTFSSSALDLIWEGNAVSLIAARSRDGWPTATVPVPACNVNVRRVGQSDIGTFNLPLGAIVYEIGNSWYPSDDVIHVKGPCAPGALRGLGVLENHLRGALALSGELDRQARSVGNAGVPTGVLKSTDPDLDKDTAAELKTSWLASQRDRTVAVLNETTDFVPLAWNPTETQLLEARRFSLHEIALIFGIDPSWLGVTGASMTYSNVEQEAINLIKFSLGGHLARFESAYTLALPRGTQAKANLDAILRSDTLSRYQAHEIGVRAGFLTKDEARALEDRPPLTPAQIAAEAPPAAPAPAPPAGTAARSFKDSPGNVKALHDYWVRGEGLVKWALAPQPLLALFSELNKYMPTAKAKWTTLAWFDEGMGRPPVTADGDLPEVIAEKVKAA